MRLCWLCTTPFGAPVVPLVYAIAAGQYGSMAERAPDDVAAPLASRHDGSRMSMTWRTRDRDAARSAKALPSVSTTAARPWRTSPVCCGSDNAGLIPIQRAPMRIVARKAMSTWAGLRTEAATPVPRRTPRLRSADVTRTTSSSSCAYVRRTSGSTTAAEPGARSIRGREEVVDEERIRGRVHPAEYARVGGPLGYAPAVNVTGWEALLFYSVVLIVLAILGRLAWVLLRGRRGPRT